MVYSNFKQSKICPIRHEIYSYYEPYSYVIFLFACWCGSLLECVDGCVRNNVVSHFLWPFWVADAVKPPISRCAGHVTMAKVTPHEETMMWKFRLLPWCYKKVSSFRHLFVMQKNERGIQSTRRTRSEVLRVQSSNDCDHRS